VRGECTANDFAKPEPINFGPPGSSTINTNKTCFSCFRIPTLHAGSTPGVIHAFAEARRGELTASFHQYTGSGAESCPDGPDTRLAYKRSIDNGASWSPVKILMQPANERAENGHCQSQAAALLDPTTKTLFVGFNSGGPLCQGVSAPMLVNSTDDGLTFSAPYPMKLSGSRTRSVSIGPTKGLTVASPSGGVRLMMPGENGGAASIFSDDHGRSWVSNNTLSPGEMDCASRLSLS
jgi:sialidase-1